MTAVDHLISYLVATKDLAICYDGRTDPSQLFKVFSDASFADNSDRKSTSGYLFTLYGGPFDWSARKQRTVSTSTTEAELLALAAAGKQLLWIKRFFRSITFDPMVQMEIFCDNKPTVDLMIRSKSVYTTKLRHVDIHRHWLRQEVQTKALRINWIPSSEMLADGLTKQFLPQKHRDFVQRLNMEVPPSSLTSITV
ncbi:uncharacterized protein N7483_001743 [Penicillium malachiteum]|nr:uncharacterized protein N7483_001743 [Penicillium malachiteum]KAJ5736618.1 hypothetical protein N7483_001743 [Penicillium malachiteum]